MNRSSTGIMKMFLADSRTSLIVFWSILFAIYLLLVATLLRFNDGNVSSGGISPLYVYMFILGIVGLRESLPYALGMNVRRRDYFTGVMTGGLALAAGFSAIVTLLSRIEYAFTGTFDLISVSFFHTALFEKVGVAGEWGTQFVFICFFFTLGFLLSLLQKRFGAVSLYLLGGAAVLAVFLMSIWGGWPYVFDWLFRLESVAAFALWLIPVVALNIVLSYVLMRRVTV